MWNLFYTKTYISPSTGETVRPAKDSSTSVADASGSMNARVVCGTLGDRANAGITFVDASSTNSPVTVGAVDPNSPFNGLVDVGEVVFAVNGVSLLGSTTQQANQLTASSPDIKLSVAKYHTPTTVHIP